MNSEAVQQTYRTLSKILQRDLTPYKVPATVIFCIGFVGMVILLFNEVNTYLSMAVFILPALFGFIFYTAYIRYPLGVALTDYLTAVKQARLSGDELIDQKCLLTKQQLQRIFTHNGDDFHGDQDALSTQVVEGLKHLSFSKEEYNPEYDALVTLIRGWKERKK